MASPINPFLRKDGTKAMSGQLVCNSIVVVKMGQKLHVGNISISYDGTYFNIRDENTNTLIQRLSKDT